MCGDQEQGLLTLTALCNVHAGVAYAPTLKGQMAGGLAEPMLFDVLVHWVLPELNAACLASLRASCHSLCNLLDKPALTPLWTSATRLLLPEPQHASDVDQPDFSTGHPSIASDTMGEIHEGPQESLRRQLLKQAEQMRSLTPYTTMSKTFASASRMQTASWSSCGKWLAVLVSGRLQVRDKANCLLIERSFDSEAMHPTWATQRPFLLYATENQDVGQGCYGKTIVTKQILHCLIIPSLQAYERQVRSAPGSKTSLEPLQMAMASKSGMVACRSKIGVSLLKVPYLHQTTLFRPPFVYASAQAESISFSPAACKLAVTWAISPDQSATILDVFEVANGHRICTFTCRPIWNQWSPNSMHLLVHASDQILMLDTALGEAVQLSGPVAEAKPKYSPWLPDGSLAVLRCKARSGSMWSQFFALQPDGTAAFAWEHPPCRIANELPLPSLLRTVRTHS